MNFEAQMKNLEKQIKAATDGTYSVEEVVNDEFVRKNTQFESKEEFFKAAPQVLNETKDLDTLSNPDVDKFIAENSSFKTWIELKEAAKKIFVKQLLKKKGFNVQ